MYQPTTLQECFTVKRIVTVHYFEFSKDYDFHGEAHDFWEFVYLDRGEADVWLDDRTVRLRQGEIVFHKPNQWHTIRATGAIAPNIAIVSFISRSSRMGFFADRILPLSQQEKQALSIIIGEARVAFSSPLDDPYTEKLEREIPYPDSEQMIRLHLEYLLLSLYRRGSGWQSGDTRERRLGRQADGRVNKSAFDSEISDEAVRFMKTRLNARLRFEEVCEHVGVSGPTLKKAFRSRTGKGVIEYFIDMKIERAKMFIRENSYNFTEISALLAYDTLHHFSRQFKQKSGMSPTEYAMSVKALDERVLQMRTERP